MDVRVSTHEGEAMHLRGCVTALVTVAVVLATAAPSSADWQPDQQVNSDGPTITDVGPALVGTARDGDAVAVWLEWRGDDASVVAARRPADGAWGAARVVDDVTEAPGVTGGRVGLTDLTVLPRGGSLISYQEHDPDADAAFVGRVVRLRADGSVDEQLSGDESQWRLESDREGDWLATSREYDRCACENDTYYSDGGSAPQHLGTYLGFGLRFALGGDELVYYGVHDDDGLLQRRQTLRVLRVDAATGTTRTAVLLEPSARVTGFDLDADRRGDVALAWVVDRPGARGRDAVRAVHRPAGGRWGRAQDLLTSRRASGRPAGAPQVAMDGAGRALVVWGTQRDGAGRANLDGALLRPGRLPGAVHRIARRLDPGGRTVGLDLRVGPEGTTALAFRHRTACPGDADATCHAVSAVVGRRLGRLSDPVPLTAGTPAYESVDLALSDSGLAVVLSLPSGSSVITTRVDQVAAAAPRG